MSSAWSLNAFIWTWIALIFINVGNHIPNQFAIFRDLADFGMVMNVAPPVMSREEFEARKADLRRRRESERRTER